MLAAEADKALAAGTATVQAVHPERALWGCRHERQGCEPKAPALKATKVPRPLHKSPTACCNLCQKAQPQTIVEAVSASECFVCDVCAGALSRFSGPNAPVTLRERWALGLLALQGAWKGVLSSYPCSSSSSQKL